MVYTWVNNQRWTDRKANTTCHSPRSPLRKGMKITFGRTLCHLIEFRSRKKSLLKIQRILKTCIWRSQHFWLKWAKRRITLAPSSVIHLLLVFCQSLLVTGWEALLKIPTKTRSWWQCIWKHCWRFKLKISDFSVYVKQFFPTSWTLELVQIWKSALLQCKSTKDEFKKLHTNSLYYILYFVNTVYHVLCVYCSYLRGTL